MRIQHNIAAMNSYRNYNNNASKVGKNLEKLSSGYRINRAGDDAAGLAVSEKMRAQISGLGQAQKNAKAGISYIQTAEGALQEVHDMLNRMYTLATQSANGNYADDDRSNLQSEVSELLAEIDRIGSSSKFNDKQLFNDTSVNFQIGTESSDTITVAKMSLTQSSIGGTDVSSVDISSATGASNALGTIKTAINSVSTLRGTLGAAQNRLEHTINNLSVMTENMQDAESVVRDTDIADEMMAYTKNNILIQSAQAMLAQANQMPQGVLQLLQ